MVFNAAAPSREPLSRSDGSQFLTEIQILTFRRPGTSPAEGEGSTLIIPRVAYPLHIAAGNSSKRKKEHIS